VKNYNKFSQGGKLIILRILWIFE